MSSLLKIETELLQKDIQSIDEQLGYLRNYVSEMRATEQQLEGSWDGDAKNTFREQFESDCSEIDEIIRLIEAYKNRLSEANREYLMSNDSVSSIIRSMRI